MLTYAQLKPRLDSSPFRSRFRLGEKERAFLAEKGFDAVRGQARVILTRRLAPAFPEHDGRQTPMRGHAVFIAQHAAAICCRGCLEKWHGIPRGRALTDAEIDFLADFIVDWLTDHAGDLSSFPVTPALF